MINFFSTDAIQDLNQLNCFLHLSVDSGCVKPKYVALLQLSITKLGQIQFFHFTAYNVTKFIIQLKVIKYHFPCHKYIKVPMNYYYYYYYVIRLICTIPKNLM